MAIRALLVAAICVLLVGLTLCDEFDGGVSEAERERRELGNEGVEMDIPAELLADKEYVEKLSDFRIAQDKAYAAQQRGEKVEIPMEESERKFVEEAERMIAEDEMATRPKRHSEDSEDEEGENEDEEEETEDEEEETEDEEGEDSENEEGDEDVGEYSAKKRRDAGEDEEEEEEDVEEGDEEEGGGDGEEGGGDGEDDDGDGENYEDERERLRRTIEEEEEDEQRDEEMQWLEKAKMMEAEQSGRTLYESEYGPEDGVSVEPTPPAIEVHDTDERKKRDGSATQTDEEGGDVEEESMAALMDEANDAETLRELKADEKEEEEEEEKVREKAEESTSDDGDEGEEEEEEGEEGEDEEGEGEDRDRRSNTEEDDEEDEEENKTNSTENDEDDDEEEANEEEEREEDEKQEEEEEREEDEEQEEEERKKRNAPGTEDGGDEEEESLGALMDESNAAETMRELEVAEKEDAEIERKEEERNKRLAENDGQAESGKDDTQSESSSGLTGFEQQVEKVMSTVHDLPSPHRPKRHSVQPRPGSWYIWIPRNVKKLSYVSKHNKHKYGFPPRSRKMSMCPRKISLRPRKTVGDIMSVLIDMCDKSKHRDVCAWQRVVRYKLDFVKAYYNLKGHPLQYLFDMRHVSFTQLAQCFTFLHCTKYKGRSSVCPNACRRGRCRPGKCKTTNGGLYKADYKCTCPAGYSANPKTKYPNCGLSKKKSGPTLKGLLHIKSKHGRQRPANSGRVRSGKQGKAWKVKYGKGTGRSKQHGHGKSGKQGKAWKVKLMKRRRHRGRGKSG